MVELVLFEPEPSPAAEARARRALALAALELAHGAPVVRAPPPAPAAPTPHDRGAVDASSLYAPLAATHASARLLGVAQGRILEPPVNGVHDYVRNLLVGSHGRRGNAADAQAVRIVDSKLKGKAVLLDDQRALGRAKRARSKQRAKRRTDRPTLTRKARQRLDATTEPPGGPRQAAVAEQHRHWLAYAEDVLAPMSRAELAHVAAALARGMRASPIEMHGALLRVERSRCPVYVGVRGVVIAESAHTVQLVALDGEGAPRVRTIPTRASVFAIELPGALSQALAAKGVPSLHVGFLACPLRSE